MSTVLDSNNITIYLLLHVDLVIGTVTKEMKLDTLEQTDAVVTEATV